MPHLRCLPRDRGFTLIEVLIAFVIAAIAIGAFVRATTGAVVSTRTAGRTDEAVARAASRLAMLSATALGDLDQQGDEGDGFHWQVHVQAEGVATPARQFTGIPLGSVTLYRISVVISWSERGRNRTVRLESAQLGPVS